MSMGFLEQVRTSLSRLNPAEIRTAAERRVNILLQASSSAGYAQIEDFLAQAQDVTRVARVGPGIINHILDGQRAAERCIADGIRAFRPGPAAHGSPFIGKGVFIRRIQEGLFER